MITLEVDIDAAPVRAMDTARALRDQLRKLNIAESVELARVASGHDAGAKGQGEMLSLATVVLTLVPVGAQAAIDWLKDYVQRPGASPMQLRLRLESGASVEAAFDPTTTKPEEVVRIAAKLKSVLEG